jgi:cytochrome c553
MCNEIRPTCLNYGCERKVTHSGGPNSGGRWRPFCTRCHKANYGAAVLAEGVTAYRTGKCVNDDGRLGFYCPIDYDTAPWAIGMTEVDHIDGNHLNNVPENAQELCSMCHGRKGKLNGDFKNQGRYKYNKAKKTA